MVFLSATVRDGTRMLRIADPAAPPGPGYVTAAGIIEWAHRQRAAAPMAGARLVASSVPATPSARPWSPGELLDRAELVGEGPGGRGLWFRSKDPAWDADRNERFAGEVASGRPAAGEVWVHVEGRDGQAYLDRRPLPADVLADVLAELSVDATV